MNATKPIDSKRVIRSAISKLSDSDLCLLSELAFELLKEHQRAYSKSDPPLNRQEKSYIKTSFVLQKVFDDARKRCGNVPSLRLIQGGVS